ncbi:Transcriptional activator protein BglJ [Serratia sp. Tan611]|nr:Transcriptional activator protein BglJ [Serratia sp. Tan611]
MGGYLPFMDKDMTVDSQSISRIALLISCQLTAYGLERLLAHGMSHKREFWRLDSLSGTCQRLLQHADMLIISFSIQQSDWHARLLMLEALRNLRPAMPIVVIIDAHIPFLLQQLDVLHINGIISQHDSLNEIDDVLMQIFVEGSPSRHGLKSSLAGQAAASVLSQRLSTSELRALRYLLNGYSLQQTAAKMQRNKKSVIALKNKGMRKLGINHSAGLVAIRGMLENQYRQRLPSSNTSIDNRKPVTASR